MKLKKDFILREIMGDVVLVPINQSTSQFNGLITVNELGKFIWENLEKVQDENDLLQLILDEYEVERDVAKKDLDEFLQVLKDMDII
ncbi:MAG: PqqD family protein [Clostridium sp.]|uniref:PqqD family protein n=1 Tax=Intestinibacter bartlettii TaxID=261299 RepID=UPI000D7A9DBF|nr:PqqD family protein [Intestinibacter bartlettii]MCB5720690.1 PqqD family protein [Intestinibacter bartlettii]MDU2693158.1 PqqD family protein [Intestinibacter bartlettii]PWM75984.1 MAG: PqqD family protein [Clostridium sp.]